ncbi:UNVERIFIED_CONTAM: ATP-dependent RNA helicase-like protein DB10 [Sesamum radiatum]|uniref:RNA helicase n=1 Tax=Sesamum radiatum TaxID=300843 RepID=A0AAW2VQQ0_SESRA
MAAATASSASVRYAPEDPTLPKPWRGLVDCKTGYLYFWNPETNTTQYERPVASSHASSLPPQESLSSSVQTTSGHCWKNENEDRYNQGSNGGSEKVASGAGTNQYVEVLSPMDKRRRLEQILRSQEPGSKIIIFCSTKKMCDHLAGNLTRQFGAAAIHGDKSQGERDHVLNQFRTGRSPVLVATDVAARGLDIKDIRVVINYDFPTGIEDYVHRIGRTGRAGATGVAYTFFCDQDGRHASDLVKLLEGANQNVPVEVRDMASRGGGMGRGRRQWSSGPSGQFDSSYSGRDAGRGGWGMSSSPDRGVSRGYDYKQQERHDAGSFEQDTNATGSFHYKSFHESMMAAAKDGAPSRRSFHETMMEQARPSPSTNEQTLPHGNANMKESESYDGPQSHCEQSISTPDVNKKETVGVSDNNAGQELGESSPRQSGNEEFGHGSHSNDRDEEDKCMPLAEENRDVYGAM